MKHAYVFPGQGAQFSGMGKDLYDKGGTYREMFETANKFLGFRISDIMFEGSAEELKRTDVTQPAVYLHSVIKALDYEQPDMVAGHSLGEFSALTVCGALQFIDGLRLVSARARAMQKACELRQGGMAAVIGLEPSVIEQVCADVSRNGAANDGAETMGKYGEVVAANYNSDGQTVISGDKPAVEEACKWLEEAGAKRTVMLQVGGAFHSPLMEPASREFDNALLKTRIHFPHCPIYQNVFGEPTMNPDTIKTHLLLQLTHPVRWTQTIRNMRTDAAAELGVPAVEAIEFTEIGPGNTLTGLIRRIAY